VTAGYFAFVRRDAARRYRAELPDFPGCRVDCERVAELASALREAIVRQAATSGWPAPTRQEKLQSPPDAHDGYWLRVDASEQAR